MSNMEEKLSALEKRLEAAERELSRLKAKSELSNLMGRYAIYFGAEQGQRILDELWSQEEDVTLEYGASAVYRGNFQLKTFYINKIVPGKFSTVSFSSPEIRLNEAGTEAWGVWTAFGTETDAGDLGSVPVEEGDNRRILFSSETEDGSQYRSEILLQKYQVRFRLENGAWKIVALHVHEYFHCPYGKDWVRYAQERFCTDGVWLEDKFETPLEFPFGIRENLPAESSTCHWQYTVDAVPTLLPDYSDPFQPES